MERPYYLATVTLTDAWVRIDEYGLGCEYHADTPNDRRTHIISWEESFELVELGAGRRKIWCMDHQSERDGQQAREEGAVVF